MDHTYVDENEIAERYLKRSLTPQERLGFESHLVDCQECSDRVLLAEMFRARNGSAGLLSNTPSEDPRPSLILRLKTRDIAIIISTLLLALFAPVVYYFFWGS